MQIQENHLLAIIRSTAITIYPNDLEPQHKLPLTPAKQSARPHWIQQKTISSARRFNRFSLSHHRNAIGFPLGIYIDFYV
jgi:hypothetical protein